MKTDQLLGYLNTRPVIEQPSDPTIRHIPLTQGLYAIVDSADYDWLNRWRWMSCQKRLNGSFYATRNGYRSQGEKSPVQMHRAILGLERGDKRCGDHINGNTLDNRRSNLRIATIQQNAWNQRRKSKRSLKGVIKQTQGTTWASVITVNGKPIYLGNFSTAEQAHAAYREAANVHFGEFARYE